MKRLGFLALGLCAMVRSVTRTRSQLRTTTNGGTRFATQNVADVGRGLAARSDAWERCANGEESASAARTVPRSRPPGPLSCKADARGAFPNEEIDLFAIGLGRTEGELPPDRIVTGNQPVTSAATILLGGKAPMPSYSALVAPGV